jgi:hypothetical protein
LRDPARSAGRAAAPVRYPRGVEIDVEALAKRILRPDRPKLAEARAAVVGITDQRARIKGKSKGTALTS